MAKYERPEVQFKPRNKDEAIQWRRDRRQAIYSYRWSKTYKYENPLTGKKRYNPPKATVYKSSDASKAIKQSNRAYRSGNGYFAKTLVASAVSILILIGLIATVFFAYDNSQRADGEPFVYFSPARFLENLSSDVVYIQADTYEVEYYYRWNILPFRSNYVGYIQVGNRRIKSENYIFKQVINDQNLVFSFYIDGVLYTTDQYMLSEPLFDGDVEVGRKIVLPEITYTWNEMPDFGEVADIWSRVGEDESFFDALSKTGIYITNFLEYQGNLLSALLPWNSSVSSSETPSDGVTYDDTWKK